MGGESERETDDLGYKEINYSLSFPRKSKNLKNNDLHFISRITLRRVNPEDLQDFVRVYKRSYEGLEEYAYTKNRQVKSYFRWMFSRDSEGFFVAEIDAGSFNSVDSRKIGFVMADTNWFSPFEMRKVGEIHELFVLPEFRNLGVGTALISRAFEYMKLKGRKVAELWVGHRNYTAHRFYRKLGFEEKSPFGKWIRMVKVLQ